MSEQDYRPETLAFAQAEAAQATREDSLRARDRERIHHIRSHGRWYHLLWLLAGPGVLVMMGENDGPSMVSYATTGATYGIGFFIPFILLTFVMAFVVQEMAVRLGVATGRGHAELIFQRFGPFWGYFAMADLVVGNVLTLNLSPFKPAACISECRPGCRWPAASRWLPRRWGCGAMPPGNGF
jgi:hypothetical protein